MAMRRRRRPRTRRRELVLTVAAVAGLIVLGVVALAVVVTRLRPDLPDAARQRADIGAGAPVTTMEILTRQDGAAWVAWPANKPMCTVQGASEQEARTHVGMAAQLALRAECQATSTGPPPEAGWYADPKREMGDDGLRWWDGAAWTLWVWSPTHWGPAPER
jgi:hypothetical protein